MKIEKLPSRILLWLTPVIALGIMYPLAAQEEELDPSIEGAIELDPTRAQEEAAGLVDSADKSGTNPINFTFDARLYNEYQWLNVPGNGGSNVTTFEYRQPFAEGKWQARAKIRANNLDIDQAGISEFGFGDMDVRFLTVPIMNAEKKFAFAYGAEFYIPTASDDLLGNGQLSVAPQIFMAFFAPFGGLVDLIAPGYQHQMSVYEEDGRAERRLGIIDLFILKSFNDKKNWWMLNPQGIMDYESKQYWVQFDVEVGAMLPKMGDGHSAYVRPSYGMGSASPYDWSLEVGYKIIW
jgi:hypothetical protein